MSTHVSKAAIRLAFAAAAACSSLPVSGPAVAAETDAQAGTIEQVTVTARRREESLQDVPVAITALTAQNTVGVTGVHPVPPPFIVEQVRAVASDIGVEEFLTGDRRVEAFRQFLRAYRSWLAAGADEEHAAADLDTGSLIAYTETADAVLAGDESHPKVKRSHAAGAP